MKAVFDKFLFSITVLLGVYIVLFILFNVLSINSAKGMMGQGGDKATEEAIARSFHLNESASTRFLIQLNELSPISIFTSVDSSSFYYNKEEYGGCKIMSIGYYGLYIKPIYLGRSFQSQEKVSVLILQKFKITIILAVFSIVFASIVGISLGILSARFYNTKIDQFILAFSAFGISAPSFFVAILIALVFGYYLSDYTGLNFKGSLIELSDLGDRVYRWKNLILPVLALGIRPVAIITQITRNSMLEVVREDYIRTARAKGLSEYTIFIKHTLRNALNPVITSISGWFGSLLAGAYFIEVIFDLKGLGALTVNALMKFDIPVIMGASLYVAFTFVLISFLVDFLYILVDPRMRK